MGTDPPILPESPNDKSTPLLSSFTMTSTSKQEQGFFNDCKARNTESSLSPTTIAVDELDIGDSHVPLDEAHNDFFGLPSNPLSIYHTGPAWPLPSGPQAQRVPKEARPVCIHAISSVWHELGEKIYKFFDSIGLRWTSIDPVRFAEVGKEPGPLFLWVGVLPGTLSDDDAKGPAARCKELLLEYTITDVEIAFRESIYTRHTGPKLLGHVSSVDPTVDVCVPFTPTLGLQIAPKDFPYFDGTGCLYLCEGGESDRIFILTARHVGLPLSEYPNELYHRKNNSMPRREVIHLGSRAFQNALEAMMDKIGHWSSIATSLPSGAQRASAFWDMSSTPLQFPSAPATASLQKTGLSLSSTALSSTGTPFQVTLYISFMKKMYPHAETRSKFKYPPGGLMQLRNIVTYNELRNPTMLDANGENCIIVVKNGAATGVTLGRATGIESFVREYKDYAIHSTSREVAVYPYSNKDGAFSAPGDSGSVVGDANSSIVGMLTGGSGLSDSTDVTYLSAYTLLNESIRRVFPHSYLYPIRKPTQA